MNCQNIIVFFHLILKLAQDHNGKKLPLFQDLVKIYSLLQMEIKVLSFLKWMTEEIFCGSLILRPELWEAGSQSDRCPIRAMSTLTTSLI